MLQPTMFRAAMMTSIKLRRPHSRAASAVRMACQRDLAPESGMNRPSSEDWCSPDGSGQATGLVPSEGLDRCGTVPGSHRTSLADRQPRNTPEPPATYKAGRYLVKAQQMIRYELALIAWGGSIAARLDGACWLLVTPGRAGRPPGCQGAGSGAPARPVRW